MNIPNTITLIRIALTPLFMAAMALDWYEPVNLPLLIFAVASLTDGVDGFIARRYNLITTFGKFIDPLADKILVSAALLMLMERGQIAAWAVMVIIARDFIVTSLRLVAVDAGVVMAAKLSGKVKMFTQVLVLMFMLSSYGASSALTPYFVYVMVAVTAWSGIDYVWKNRQLLMAKQR